MSTRSLIAVQNPTSISYIYCHHDGYPSGVGASLAQDFATEQAARDLLKLGDLSECWHGAVVAFHRDLGGEFTEPGECANERELAEDARNCDCEFAYLFRDGKWHVAAKRGIERGMANCLAEPWRFVELVINDNPTANRPVP